MAEWVIEPLAAQHEREEFSCGKAPLDKFIRELAERYERQDVGRTYVAVRDPARSASSAITHSQPAASH
jgi:hypothetical protein